jgi:flagellar protein FlaF
MPRTPSYFRTPQIGAATPRETEILAFGLCNDRLTKATTPRERTVALAKTQQLWSLLVRDLGAKGNQLPDTLKQNLIRLGFWAMNYATRATLRDLSVAPLIEVNRNMIDGLRAQARNPEAASTEAWTNRQVTV